jgi:hypothetical protein
MYQTGGVDSGKTTVDPNIKQLGDMVDEIFTLREKLTKANSEIERLNCLIQESHAKAFNEPVAPKSR